MTPNQVQATSDRVQGGGGGEIRNHYEPSAFEARSSVKTFFHKINSKTFAVNDLGRAVAFTSGSRELFIPILYDGNDCWYCGNQWRSDFPQRTDIKWTHSAVIEFVELIIITI